jgi:hypothetical protein
MKLIILPGNSGKNQDWVQKVASALRSLFDGVEVHGYDHWQTGEELIDLETELTKLRALLGNQSKFWIFGKSAGTLLTLKGVREGTIKPLGCIFTGLPINWARHHKFPIDKYLQGYSVPTLFMQQTADPSFGFAELQQLLAEKQVKDYKAVEVPGDNHHYQDVAQIQSEVKSFLEAHDN